MAYRSCPCGLTYDTGLSAEACPKCGRPAAAPVPVADDKIRFACACGARLSATSRFVGRSIDCPACGSAAPVPAASIAAAPSSTVRRRNAAPRPPSRPDGWRSTARWGLLAALIPLAFASFWPADDLKERVEETKKQNPTVVSKFERSGGTLDELFAALPSHRLSGAAFARTTKAHWLFALLSALVFWEFILIIQPMGNSTSRQLWAVGIFTGTIGIVLLLAISLAGLVIPIIRYCFLAAADPESNFLASMVGFTIGVGLLEEFCKALPLFWHFRRAGTLDVRGAVVWGLATGIGFGVSEGVSYSENLYNGISTGDIYVVRFISCVAIHAIWSATAAILIWWKQEEIQAVQHPFQWAAPLGMTLGISMVLHGFYDTCLKKGMDAAGLGCAMLSFALFFLLYDRACRHERRLRTAPASA